MWTVEIDGDLYCDLLDDRFRNGVFSPSEEAEALWDQLLDLIRDSGVDPKHSDPKYIVDNYIVNGEFVNKREDWHKGNYYYDKYNGDWEDFAKANVCCMTKITLA